MRPWILLLGLVGCGGGPTGPDTGDTPKTGTTAGSGTPTGTPTGSTVQTFADEARVRELIAGDAVLDEVLHEVAWSGGWPVPTEAGTWLFVLADVDDAGGWALAGDHDGWAGTALTAGDGFGWIEVEVPEPEGSGYKFVREDTWVADPIARSYTWDPNGQLSFVRPPTDRARLDRWPDLEAEGLLPRTLRVHVPPGAGPWPVVYAHDGQNLFSPDAIWGGWQLSDALGSREDMVVVGIDNTPARFDEYTHTIDAIGGVEYGGLADVYGRLVLDHVRPHIEGTYGSTGHDGLLGSSLGGLVNLVMVDLQPGEWDVAISMSGTLGWGRLERSNETVGERWVDNTPDGTVLYLDSGGSPGLDGVCLDLDGDGSTADDPDSSDNYCETRAFADARAAAGWTWDADLFHWHEPGQPHNEAAWAQRVGRTLDVFLDAR